MVIDPGSLLVPLATQGILGAIAAYAFYRLRERDARIDDLTDSLIANLDRKSESEKLLAISQAQLAETVERLYNLVTRNQDR